MNLKKASDVNLGFKKIAWLAVLASLLIGGFFYLQNSTDKNQRTETASESSKLQANPQASLTVTTVKPQLGVLNKTVSANGNIAAWQESSISSETSDLLLREVLVNLGDHVKRGQVLARFASATLEADSAQMQANVAEAKAVWMEAASNASRARNIQDSGALSQQQIEQYSSAEASAKARLNAAQASLHAKNIKLGQTAVIAPDDGIISLSPATVGTVYASGQELFRLIRKGRLEWRAELPSADLLQIKNGMKAQISLPDGSSTQGRVRSVAPVVDAKTRNALIYVDIPAASAKSGMFARGHFVLGTQQGFTLPYNAIVMRDGFAYVMQVEKNSPDKLIHDQHTPSRQTATIKQVKVELGQRVGERVALLNLEAPEADYVENGGAFLTDGDNVRVVAK